MVAVMKHQNLQDRTRRFALDVIRFVESLPTSETCKILGRQLLRSGTSTAANYRAACRARSKADFIAKMGVVVEEADESAFWMELLIDAHKTTPEKSGALLREANELVAIAVSSINTSRRNPSD